MKKIVQSMCAVATAAAVLGGFTHAEDSSGDKLESARATLAQWVETQQMISKEKEDWQMSKEVLEQRIELLEDEIASLKEKIANTRESISSAEEQKAELTQQRAQLKEASQALDETIAGLEQRVRELLPRLPRPIADKVAPLADRLPDDSSDTAKSLSERFQNVVGILNSVNKFNREITLANEVRQLPDGTKAEVQTLYLGLGQAYYVTANGKRAGIGWPGADGWSWSAADELAGEVTRVIEILENEKAPAYVPLPAEIQ
jgi:septal ring factor EnvC (AmiA/AmiB activator)